MTDLLTWIHDEDSFNPMEIDDERELTDDEEFMLDIIDETIDELETASKKGETVTISREIARQALQLIKAYSTCYDLSLEDYQEEYEVEEDE